MSLPDDNSLYSLLMKNQTRLKKDGGQFYTTVDTLAQFKGLTLERYQQLLTEDHMHLTNRRIVDILFEPGNDAQRTLCVGDVSRDNFEAWFQRGLELNKQNAERLVDVFGYTSFPETYLHPQIAQVLRTSGKLMNKDAAQKRIGETALIMVQTLKKKCGLATMALVAASHLIRNLRGNPNYNEDTVEFTLLTFSYFGAKRSGVQEAQWFFYWKVFGSLMGLPPNRLHGNFDKAKDRMAELHQQCPRVPTDDSKALLDVFIEAFDIADEIPRINQKGLVSKRMHAYLQSRKLWPEALLRSKSPSGD